jgi:hypothetical protein
MSKIHSALEAVARREIPENTDLWPQIATRLERKDTVHINPKLKLTWTVVLVLLGLLLATTAAYALYRYFSDPGLQAVSDAGMFTNINSTAQPTILPTSTLNIQATPKAEQQTSLATESSGNLTATLISAYADAQRLAFTVHFDGWQANYNLNLPFLEDADGTQLNFQTGSTPSDSDPATWTIDIAPPANLQIERFKGKLHIFVDSSAQPRFAQFDFDLDLPVYKVIVLEPEQSVTAHGVEMKLEKIELSPAHTKIHVCVHSPGNLSGAWAPLWKPLEIDQNGASQVAPGEIGGFDLGNVPGPGSCTESGFPVGYQNHLKTLTLTMEGLMLGLGNTHSAESLTPTDFKLAQEKLKAQGIETTYDETFLKTVEWMDGFNIKKKPEGMSTDQVRMLFYEALGIYYPGPWTFTIDVP